MEPEVNQYSGHMVMTNVSRPLRKKYLNIDTRFRDNYTNVNTVNITLPEIVRNVRAMKAMSIEVPFSYFNISESLGNNTILFTDNTGTQTSYTVADGFYTNNLGAENTTTINSYFSSNHINSYISYQQATSNKYFSEFVFTPSGSVTSMTIAFGVDSSGNASRTDLKSKLGWNLGFRNASYQMTTSKTTLVSEAMVSLTGFRYLYLLVDDYQKNCDDNNFISPLYSSFINKNILARITMDTPIMRPFGDCTITATEKMGFLVSDTRNYTDTGANLQRLNVSLVNEYGNIVNLNGLDYSFVLMLEYE